MLIVNHFSKCSIVLQFFIGFVNEFGISLSVLVNFRFSGRLQRLAVRYDPPRQRLKAIRRVNTFLTVGVRRDRL